MKNLIISFLLLTSVSFAQEKILINGAGATFPYPLYSKWIAEYGKVNSDVQINYQSIGSGGGIRQITEKTVDFGASDAPMTDDQLSKVEWKLVHLPMTLGAVVVTYNVPGASEHLKFTPELLASIYLGEIAKWDDKRIVEINPGAKLPAKEITVVHRSDGSGTTAVFTDYLSKVSPTWKEKVGNNTSVNWPAGLGGKGNEGVTGQVKSIPGSIGYVELAYATQNKLPYAAIRNQTGQFVVAKTASITAAAASVADKIPDDYRVSITNAPGKEAYPISSFTYILVYKDSVDQAKAKALAKYLVWSLTDGQKFASALDYAQLPPALGKRVLATVKTLKSSGKFVLSD